jgi:hypothetical protein
MILYISPTTLPESIPMGRERTIQGLSHHALHQIVTNDGEALARNPSLHFASFESMEGIRCFQLPSQMTFSVMRGVVLARGPARQPVRS